MTIFYKWKILEAMVVVSGRLPSRIIYREPGLLEVVLYDSAPRPPPSPLLRQQVVSLFQFSCVSPVELTNGKTGMGGGWPTELVQHSANRESSHRRKCRYSSHIFNMVWLHRSPIPAGREVVFYLLKLCGSTCGGYRRVRGSQHPVRFTGISKHTKISCVIVV